MKLIRFTALVAALTPGVLFAHETGSPHLHTGVVAIAIVIVVAAVGTAYSRRNAR